MRRRVRVIRCERAAAVLITVVVLGLAGRGAAAEPASDGAFVHPGLLHTHEDLQVIKQRAAAGREPWAGGFTLLRDDPASRADVKMRGPFERVVRGRQWVHNTEMVADANAAYQNALMWCITGDEAHARKAVQILDAWSGTLKSISGHDAILAAGLNGFKFVNAAELMRSTYAKWPADRVARCQRMCREVIEPVIDDFAPFANGNWGASCVATMMSIGVFCDDRALFDKAVEYYRHGKGNACITHYVINATGQCQESGRDQPHTQLGLGLLAEACEIAWHQGVDLYGEADNRLMHGFEYTARYNLGESVPFVRQTDTTGKYSHDRISDKGRGRFRPIYEMAYNHYHHRRGLDMPSVRRVLAKTRPEGAAFECDHPGFGTTLFCDTP